MARKPYPSDVSDEEWKFVVPYLTLMREDAPQRGLLEANEIRAARLVDESAGDRELDISLTHSALEL
jgi:hypothetical protein